MRDIIISEGQGLLDAVVQNFGDLEQAFDFAIEQGLSVSDFIAPGTYKTALKVESKNIQIVETLNSPHWMYALNYEKPDEGIGISGIAVDFEIG